MTNRPKAIGTAGETAVVRWLQKHGFPAAERIALHGGLDEGDATACPGIGVEVKAGKSAETASDAQVAAWLVEAETERYNRGAVIMLLVLKRKGKGPDNAGQWWTFLPGRTFARLGMLVEPYPELLPMPAVRVTLEEAAQLIRRNGYGEPL